MADASPPLPQPERETINPLYDTRPRPLTHGQQVQVRLLGWAGAQLVRLLGRTLRFDVLGLEHLEREHAAGRRVIFAFWHRCIFAATWFWRQRGIVVLNSVNFDGQWTRRVIERLGFGTAQGSSTRGGLRGLAVMAERLRQGRDVAFTIDGPRGPRYVAKPGAVLLARRTGMPILAFHIGVERAWTLKKSWDLFQIPQPFSRAVVVIAPPVEVPERAAAETMARKQAELQHRLEQARDTAEAWFHLTPAERETLRRQWPA
ncbi:MAG: lysophospholipid acyltransferase family protein [Firmicutes bacterium]|nr:lysophospholipid acyltransferase family protein [Bacillota bacterium]